MGFRTPRYADKSEVWDSQKKGVVTQKGKGIFLKGGVGESSLSVRF